MVKEGIFNTSLKKSGGKLIHIRKGSEVSYKEFIKQLDEGDQVDMYMEINNADNTLLQLAKVHKCIREIAKHTGNSFDVDPEAGHHDKMYMDWKSFAKLSKDDLGLAIQACIELGDIVGLNLR
jgi:hypothetical protein